ncbi:phosphonate ABC transporter, permease protein PhnE [Marinivivus vitaminiproducens]|uniref:phosphonate ABC transporter, permease protein PhnE n=1 Tax=Marinivivus vitaminiproducens TaxID=3035935 RepID=UPI0027A59A07|nr:phosphonate ABC transporter, permease protein PhnE [Geminicoccaceae bacterium SCSIO 64248]
MSVVSSLSDERRRSLTSVYDEAVRGKRRRLILFLAVVVGLAILAGWTADVRLLALAENIGRFTSYIGRILPDLSFATFFSDVAAWYWDFGGWLGLLVETLLIAYLGTLLGGLAAFLLCFLAASNLVPNAPLRFAAKRTLEVCRTVPEIVFALLFVIAFGLGPMAGVLAIALHTTGALGKLFAEVVENIDMKPIEGVRAAGGSWVQAIRYAVLPQVLPNFASYALLRFEINVRGASVMGFVGAGGIGQALVTAIRQFYYSDVSAILLLIILTVVAIDLGTERVRHRLIGLQGAH